MADQILKLKDIEDFFFDITCHMLGYTTEEEMSKVRIAWQSDGAPSWKIDEDVVSLSANFSVYSYGRHPLRLAKRMW